MANYIIQWNSRFYVRSSVNTLFPIRILPFGTGYAHDRIRNSNQIYLLLQLQRICPIIIALAEGDELATAMRIVASAITTGGMGIATEVMVAPENADFVGIFLLVLEADLAGFVGGAVFADDELKFKIGLLHHHAFDGLADVGFMIVGDHVYRDDRVLAELLGIGGLDAGNVHRVAREHLNGFTA